MWMSKNTKASFFFCFFFALDMGNLYLASELPWGENCHSITVLREPWSMPEQVHPKSADTWTSVKDSLIEPEVRQSTSKSEQWRVPTRPKEPAASSPAAAATAAAGFSSDKCTSGWQNHNKKKEKERKDVHRRWPAFCIIVMVWYTERKGTGRRSRHCLIGMIVAVFPMIPPHLSIIQASVWGGSNGWLQIQVQPSDLTFIQTVAAFQKKRHIKPG